ncbi:MAG: hypothetical protein ABH833_03420 [Parcubacteria group bacterium]
MTSISRFVRRFIYFLAFIIIIGAIGFGIYRILYPPQPIPTPGPMLDPIEVISTDVIEVKENDYDFVVQVRNPNPNFGSPDVRYEIYFFDENDTKLSTHSGDFYILPSQKKYIVRTGLPSSSAISRVEFKIIRADWQQLDELGSQGVSLVMTRSGYYQSGESSVFGVAEGRIFNDSAFDVAQVDVVILLEDNRSQSIAVNKTAIRTFLSQTTRGFEVQWFDVFEGEVESVYIEANTNIFENENFLLSHGGIERFQQQF